MSKGVWYGVAAHVAWGLSPLYWKQLDTLAAPVLTSHRVLWSFLLLAGLRVVFRRRYRFATPQPGLRVVGVSIIAAILICANWTAYVWAVTTDLIVEASLGYFITPLVSVGLGVVILRERLRLAQWTAVGLGAVGLLYLTAAVGSLPWIALCLAGTFGLYGLAKKTTPLDPVQGLTAETGLLLLPATAFLLWGPSQIPSSGLDGPGLPLLVGTGLLTVGPLLLFAASVHRIPLSHLGIIQHLAPTLQFLLAVLLYDEPFSGTQFVGYGLVWAALLLFAAEGLYAQPGLTGDG